jgi:hypothetical protein
VIISASYKTDIPAFYGEWFMRRLRAGYCKMVNPYGRQVYTVNLRPEADEDIREGVEGIVFWTKNIGPLMKHLPEIVEQGHKFVVQHTINGYPRELESRVVDYSRTVQHMKELRDFAVAHKLHLPIWRYDPVLITELTPVESHIRNFASLAQQLEGTTDECVLSFAHVYGKTKRNLDAAAKESGFSWLEHNDYEYHEGEENERALYLVRILGEIAREYSISLKICAQKGLTVPELVEEAHCIDASWFGNEYKQHGNRPECACSASRDIGEYDTCPHGCVYCYAVQNREKALDRYKRHNPESEFLFEPDTSLIQVEREPKKANAANRFRRRTKSKVEAAPLPQPRLFGDE